MNVYFTGSLYPARIIIDNGSGGNGENPGENPNPGDNKGNATMVISQSTTLTPEMLAGILFLFITVTKENITITLPSLANTSKGTAINLYTTFTTQGSISIYSNSNVLNGPDGTVVSDISFTSPEEVIHSISSRNDLYFCRTISIRRNIFLIKNSHIPRCTIII
jgi:hypothetical protein